MNDDNDPLNWTEKLAARLSNPLFGKFAFLTLIILGLEIPRSATIGHGLRLPHGAVGLVVHEDSVIGCGVKLFGGVSLGRSDQYLNRSQVAKGGRVEVGDGAIIGAGAKVLFRGGQVLRVGAGAVVGANAVVTSDVPAGEIWAGAPARRVGVNPNWNSQEGFR